MISAKNLIQLSVLLLLSTPLFYTPTHAQSVTPSVTTPPCGNVGDECPLSISPAVVQGIVGSTVTVYVVINDTVGLINYFVHVQYLPNLLNPIRVHWLNLSNTWDSQPPSQPTPQSWTSGGCYTGNSYAPNGTLIQGSMPTTCIPFPVCNPNPGPHNIGCTIDNIANGCSISLTPSGCLVVAQTLLGGATDCVSTTGCSLFSIDFQILPGITECPPFCGSASILLTPNPHFFQGLWHGGPCDNSICALPQGPKSLLMSPHDGKVNGISIGSAAFIKSKVDSAIHHLKLSSGNVQTLSGIVSNTGTIPVNVRINFVIISEAGDVSFVSTGALLMPVGTNGILSVSYTVPSLPLRYHVTGILTIGDPNGIFFKNSGFTATTAYSVVL